MANSRWEYFADISSATGYHDDLFPDLDSAQQGLLGYAKDRQRYSFRYLNMIFFYPKPEVEMTFPFSNFENSQKFLPALLRKEPPVELRDIIMQKLTTVLASSAPGECLSVIISRITFIIGFRHRLQVMADFRNLSRLLIRASKFGVIIKLHPEPGRRLGSSLSPQPRNIARYLFYHHARLAKGYQDMS